MHPDDTPADRTDQQAFEAEIRRQCEELSAAARDPDSDEAAVMREIWADFVELAEAEDYDSDLLAPMTLSRNWYSYAVADGVIEGSPGLYEWHIEGVGSYIGQFTSITRPKKQYGRNVTRLLNGKPYRRGNPDGFRRIHRELLLAHREGRRITLTILMNVDAPDLNRRERELISIRGALNDPPFGRRAPSRGSGKM